MQKAASLKSKDCLPLVLRQKIPPKSGNIIPYLDLGGNRKEERMLSLKRLRVLVVGIFLTVLVQTALAEEKEKIFKLGDVVVTATRYEKAVEDAPGSVVVISKEEIERFHFVGVDEAIKFSPGVHSRRSKGRWSIGGGFSLRGFDDYKRCLVLVDGQERQDYDTIPLEIIERIEVVKGPFSALYGDKALGGVVNIITKTPEERILQLDAGVESYNTGVYKLLYGDKTGKLDFLFSAQKSKSDGYVSNLYTVKEYTGKTAATATVTGWKETKDKYGDTCYLVGDKGNNWIENDHYNLKLGYELFPEAKLGLQFYYKDYNYGYKNGESYLLNTATGDVVQPSVGESTVVEISPGGTKLKVYGTGFESSYGGGPGYGSTLSYDQELTEKVTLGAKLGWDTYDHWYADAYNNYSTTVYNRFWTGLQSTIDLTDKHILTTGLDWRDEDVDCEKWELSDWKDTKSKTSTKLTMSGKVNSWGIYLQDEWKILENLSLFSGGRYDNWGTSDGKNSYWNSATDSYISEFFSSNSEESLNPKLAAVYKPKEKTTLRSSIGTAFRGPEATNLYKDWYYYGKLYRGNPKLKPEKNQAWEIGIDQGLWKGAKGGITYFDNRMDDYICRRTLTDSEVDEYNSIYGTSYDYEKITQYDNVAEAKSAGVEIGLEQELPAGFSIFTNWTHNETEVLKNPANPDSVGKHLTYVPENIFNTGLNYTKEFAKERKLLVSLAGRYEDKVYTTDDNSDTEDGAYGGYEDYFVADFKLSYAFGKNYELIFTVGNLFDEEYYKYYKAPGRTFGLMTRIKF